MGGWYVLKDRIIDCLCSQSNVCTMLGVKKWHRQLQVTSQQYQTQQHALVCQALGSAPNPFEGNP